MLKRLRSRLTYANVASSFALFIALTTGSAYAANEWTGANIVDSSLTYVDIATNTIGSARILDNSLIAGDIAANAITASELADNAVDSPAVAADAIGASEISNDSIDGGEVVNGSLSGTDIVDNSLAAGDLAADSVGASELANNAVDSAAVLNDTLLARDLSGGVSTGSISLGAGYVANGRCRDADATVGGAKVGDAVVFSIDGPLPEGILIYGVRVPSAGEVTVKVCNFSGAPMAAVTDLPVAAFTITP